MSHWGSWVSQPSLLSLCLVGFLLSGESSLVDWMTPYLTNVKENTHCLAAPGGLGIFS